VRISPASSAFTLLLGALAALPSFGIDMSLPALGSIGASLDVSADEAGLTMSLFMIGFACAPPFWGPISDRYGRKPVVLAASTLFSVASIGCAVASTLPILLAWRIVQGAGAGVGMTIVMAIIRDLFDGEAARTRLSYVAVAMLVVPMIAPTVGSALLALGNWRSIYGVVAGMGIVLLCAIALGLSESARLETTNRLSPSALLRDYHRVLTHPICVGYMVVNAAGFGALFAYVSGSSLFLMNTVGLSPTRYGLVFAATSIGIMAGAFVNGQLSGRGVAAHYPLTIGLGFGLVSALSLVTMTLAGWTPLPCVLGLLIVSNFAFGLIAPNAIQAAMHPLPKIAGTVSAASGFIQMMVGSASSALVVMLSDGRSALSMTAPMAVCSLVALVAYLAIARPAERRTLRARDTALDGAVAPLRSPERQAGDLAFDRQAERVDDDEPLAALTSRSMT
jgi:DHA1 family bicyclomycin/chloramphenicol resistance-like MFS transporter